MYPTSERGVPAADSPARPQWFPESPLQLLFFSWATARWLQLYGMLVSPGALSPVLQMRPMLHCCAIRLVQARIQYACIGPSLQGRPVARVSADRTVAALRRQGLRVLQKMKMLPVRVSDKRAAAEMQPQRCHVHRGREWSMENGVWRVGSVRLTLAALDGG